MFAMNMRLVHNVLWNSLVSICENLPLFGPQWSPGLLMGIVMHGSKPELYRLFGNDCPEKDQDFEPVASS
jgi:hypothetical protein